MATPSRLIREVQGGAHPKPNRSCKRGSADARGIRRRYERMPHVKKAEVIEGTVYIPCPLQAWSLPHPWDPRGAHIG